MLTLQALGFQIGGDPSQAPAWDLYLPANFFAQQGFGKYQLNAMYDATVAPDVTVRLTQQNLIPNLPALRQAATGADLNTGGLTTLGTLDPYHRQATSLVMTAGSDIRWSPTPNYAGVTNAVMIGAGAAIVADAGAAIGLGSPAQVTVLGSIIAPGGSITLSADDSSTFGFAQPRAGGGDAHLTEQIGLAGHRRGAGCRRYRADRSLRRTGEDREHIGSAGNGKDTRRRVGRALGRQRLRGGAGPAP